MPQRKYTKIRAEKRRAFKRITLPIDLETYQDIVEHPEAFRRWLDEQIVKYPQLFPKAIEQGYTLHDRRKSKKMPGITLRRIKLNARSAQGNELVFTIAPSGILPYMTGKTEEVEKALFLRRFGVPYWGLAYVFGRDEQYWYRLVNQIGRLDMVATTVQTPERLPKHLLADEKHVWFNGEKAYLATTVGEDCVLGSSMALSADEAALTEAYGVFQKEAQRLDPNYQPETVNTDGWSATQAAWKALFPLIVVIECFLHAFLKIRQRARKRFKEVYPELVKRVWHVYHAPDTTAFRERVKALQAWAQHALSGPALEAVQKLVSKTDRFVLAYAHPGAYRTSNMLDRHMLPMARWLASARYFHGHRSSAEWQVRAWSLLHNFLPYSPRARASQEFLSPAHRLNGFVYHENWLHNLLISSSHAAALC